MNIVEWIPKVILVVMLGAYGVEDLKKREITTPFLVIPAVLLISVQFFQQQQSWYTLWGGVAVGAAVLILSVLSRGRIGLGDGMVLLVTGIGLGGSQNLELLMISLLYAAFFSGFLLLVKRASKNGEIPFVPFLFLGYLTMLAGEII